MKEAITKAIKGGYDAYLHPKTGVPHRDGDALDSAQIREEPLFWQALGKAEGWNGKCADCYRSGGDDYVHKMCKAGSHLDMHGKYFRNKPWVNAMYRFIDHLALGKSPDDFFTNLFNE